MALTNGNSTSSLLLFDHSIKDSLLHDSSNDIQLSNDNLFDHSNLNEDPSLSASSISSSFTTYLFFIFPIMGFFVLVVGSCLLHKRQLRQDAEAIRRYRERIDAADAQRRLKEERRSKLVEKALVSIKVAFLPKKRSMLPSFGIRERTATMETDVITVDSGSGHGDDLDSTISSSCASLGAVLRASESEASSSIGGIDEELGEAAERGQQHDTTNEDNLSNGCNSVTTSDFFTTKRPSEDTATLILEHSTTPLDWQTETCAICLEPYKENDDVSYSKHQNCTHAFHTSCILSWLKDEFRNDCPCCRGPYLHLSVVEDDGDYLGVSTTNTSTATTGTMDISQVMDPTSPNVNTNNATVEEGDYND